MAATVEVDDDTYRSLNFAAKLTATTVGDVIQRLVAQASLPESVEAGSDADSAAASLQVYADYDGVRTHGIYDRTTTLVEITSGPLKGQRFKTPTGAARAVIGHYKPQVSRSRNGWSFWVVDDGSRRRLQAVRPR